MSGGEVPTDVSLLAHLDLSQVNCLNESPDHPLKPILESKVLNQTDLFLESDADEQLLLNLYFTQKVRIKSIIIRSKNVEEAPKDIVLLTNRPSIGFDDAEDNVAQEISLQEDDVLSGKVIPLRYVKFQAVLSLHIFVIRNHGDSDKSRIDGIDVFGSTIQTARNLTGLNAEE